MTDKEIMQKAIDTYGESAQLDMVIEEMSELTKAILKDRRNTFSDGSKSSECLDNIIEEVADVEIMLEQLKIIFSCHNNIDKVKVNKLNRLKDRLESE